MARRPPIALLPVVILCGVTSGVSPTSAAGPPWGNQGNAGDHQAHARLAADRPPNPAEDGAR